MRRGRLVLGVLLLAQSGCVLNGSPVAPAEHLEHRIPEDVAADAPRLVVGRFIDGRPGFSRRAQRPLLRMHWYGVLREGQRQTGDESFGGDLAEVVRRDAAATLARSGLFAAVRTLDGSVLPDDADFLLTGVVEELVGFRYERSGLNLFRLGWLERHRDAPVGVARVRYRLYDRTGLDWDERIETRQLAPGLGPARAALDAMALGNERFATELYRRLRPAEEEALRRVSVRVLDACGLGRKRAARLVEDVSEVFEREAALRLEPEVTTWAPGRGFDAPEDVLEAVRRVSPPADGIVLGLVPTSRPRGTLSPNRFGIARQLGEHAAVACRPDGEVRPVTVAHELAHLFGAVHVRDRGSLMHPVAAFEARFLDLLNRRILRVTRVRPFGRPLPPELGREVRAIYAEASHTSADVDLEDLTVALSAVSRPTTP